MSIFICLPSVSVTHVFCEGKQIPLIPQVVISSIDLHVPFKLRQKNHVCTSATDEL